MYRYVRNMKIIIETIHRQDSVMLPRNRVTNISKTTVRNIRQNGSRVILNTVQKVDTTLKIQKARDSFL